MANHFLKKKGIYYTPPELAKFLAEISITDKKAKILDPSFGNGALLLAAFESLRAIGASNAADQLYGFDIFPLCKKMQENQKSARLNLNNLYEQDFLSISEDPKLKFSNILMNPPFIRHHKLDENTKKIESLEKWGIGISKKSDMWAYFILHSLQFLKKNGSIAAILPWSFIQAHYAKPIRNVLKENFESIEIIILGKHFFDQAQERIIILHGKNFGNRNKHLSIGYSYEIPNDRNFLTNIDNKNLNDSPWYLLFSNQYKDALKKIEKKIPICTLGDFADIKIGTVTGANSFFIVGLDTIREYQIPKTILKPIITNSKELKTLSIDSVENWGKYLLTFPENLKIEGNLLNYIRIGENIGLDKRYHTQNREIWYTIPNPKIADAFLQYMTKEIPHLVFNPSNVFSTNSVHQIFFKEKIDENTKKWLQFSMFSSISQLSIELSAKTYGGGVLKIEPSAAKKILVFSGDKKEYPQGFENSINDLLIQGRRDEIVDFVDDWFIRTYDISEKTYDKIKRCYREICSIRQS